MESKSLQNPNDPQKESSQPTNLPPKTVPSKSLSTNTPSSTIKEKLTNILSDESSSHDDKSVEENIGNSDHIPPSNQNPMKNNQNINTNDLYAYESMPNDKSNLNKSLSRSRSDLSSKSSNSDANYQEQKNQNNKNDFIMKNGCCKECMRAFSKTGKSCLCQVPKSERKFILPAAGCNYCGCHGCNPKDVRKHKRQELKQLLLNDKNLFHKNEILLDSDDEELKIFNEKIDGWNNTKRDMLYMLSKRLNCNPYFMGFGVPMRSPGYILGYSPYKNAYYQPPPIPYKNNHNYHHHKSQMQYRKNSYNNINNNSGQ